MTTEDNVKGLPPESFTQSGFADIQESASHTAAPGSLVLHKHTNVDRIGLTGSAIGSLIDLPDLQVSGYRIHRLQVGTH